MSNKLITIISEVNGLTKDSGTDTDVLFIGFVDEKSNVQYFRFSYELAKTKTAIELIEECKKQFNIIKNRKNNEKHRNTNT